MLPEQQQRIMGYFIEEAKDHLNTIEQGLLNLQVTIQDGEKANELFRAAHSVKGGAAMLGLESIQRTAHRMEDYFKILKESPVQVDRALETMFLRISDGLKDLLEQLEGPFGLTQDKAQEIMADVEPVFGQLEAHLKSLVGESGEFGTSRRDARSPDALQTSFKRDVAMLLRQMLTTFKHADNAESRRTLQDSCIELADVGEQFELSEWCDLAETARIAVSNLDNDYRKLAPILIKEIKKAQDMVLSGRASEVAVSDAMQSLLPEDLLPASEPVADALAQPLPEKITDDEISAKSADEPVAPGELSDLFGEADESRAGRFDSPLETDGDDDFTGLFDGEPGDSDVDDFDLADSDLAESGLEGSFLEDGTLEDNEEAVLTASDRQSNLNSDDEIDELAQDLFSEISEQSAIAQDEDESEEALDDLDSVNRLSVDLEFDEIPSELSALNRNAESEEKADESLDALLATVNVTGPDVGSEELNSLADLFDGDLDELDNTLGNHAFVSEEMRMNPEGIDTTAGEDLTDLFGSDSTGADSSSVDSSESVADSDELEADDLFGGTLTDGEFVELDDSFIDVAELESLNAPVETDDFDTDSSLFQGNSVESPLEDVPAEPINSLAADMVELSGDVWGESSSPQTGSEEAFSDLATAETPSSDTDLSELDVSDLGDFALDDAFADIDLGDIDLGDADINSLFEEDVLPEATKAAETAEPSGSKSVSAKAAELSLTAALIAAKPVTPRELDIEFPTLTGVKLEEAEKDIDSFFVAAKGAADDAWKGLSLESELFEADGSDESFELDNAANDDEKQPSIVEPLEEPGSSTQSNLEDDFDGFEADFLDVGLKVEQAGEELDELLEVAAKPIAVPDPTVTSDSSLEDLWGDLETSSDKSGDSGDDLDALLSSNNLSIEESIETNETARELDAVEVDIEEAVSDVSSEAIKNLSGLEEGNGTLEENFVSDLSLESLSNDLALDIETDKEEGLLDGNFLSLESVGGPVDEAENDFDLIDERNETLSEADLLDFDTAFGLNASEMNNLSAAPSDESFSEEQAADAVNELAGTTDQPEHQSTFTGDLDSFVDASDGETTISDISELRIEDAELDSLLGLDFAVPSAKGDRQPAAEAEPTSGTIDGSVLDAFSDIDDLFDDEGEFSSGETSSEGVSFEQVDTSQINLSEDDFFGSVDSNSPQGRLGHRTAEIDSTETDSTDFDELDSLLSADGGVPTETGKMPTVVGAGTTDDENFDDLERLLEDGGADSNTPVRRAAARSPRRTGSIRDQNMRVSVKHLDNLSNLVGELVVNRNTLERDQERLRQFLDNLLFQVQQLNDVGQRLRDLYERSLLESSLMSNKRPAAPNGGTEAKGDHATGVTFDALEMDRFTGFHSLSQEMIELIVRVRESSSDIGYTVESSDQVTRQFRQITTQLQEGLNTARMVAFSQAADRLPRAVRDISLKCGKEARLAVEGQDTLIDKMIVEHLYDPLTHLVNNAITHGIEMPEARAAAGKPQEGTITVRAFYQGNQTVLYVSDDGGGIDTKFVQRKAVEKNLISKAEADSLSDIETYDLLFHPGFSTRDQADDFAGRGVGMDVVRTSLAEIRGSITIDSEMGRGTSFTIRLPLTLSISKALSCVSNQARIAFPMDGVEDMLDVLRDRVIQNEQGQDCVRWRDTVLPFQPVTDLLKFNRTLGRGRVYGGSQDDDILSVIVLRSANTYVAVQVDQVIGEEEIVIKQLEGPVPKPLGIAGATVLGDGRVMPIADVLELIDIAMGRVRRETSSMVWAQEGMAAVEETPAKSEPTVLIVDDSITVRELLSMSFNKVGYRVEQARDGQEAWDKLRSGLPCDLVFCDIEMPRMDGLELLSRMQKDSQLKRVPIAMLTSRGADRHRQMAVDLGASGYFTKPYLEEALLDAAQRMLNGETLEKGRGG